MVSTLTGVTAVAGVVTLGLTVVARRHRHEPGGRWFLSMAAVMAVSSLLYAVALTVTDPFVRHLLEAAFSVGSLYAGLLWVAFALEYTGRGASLRGPLGPAGLLVGAVGGAAILTDPIHGTLFADFAVRTTMGAATVSFTPGPGLFALLSVVGMLIGAAWLLLFDTVADAGPLFRRQTVALAVTPLFPTLAAFLFVFDLGPVAGFNLVAVSYAPHAALDLYALYSGDLFDFDPAVHRIGTRAALSSVGVPVVTVDTDGRVIAVDSPDALFDRPEPALVGEPLNDLLSTPIDPATDPGVVELRTPDGVGQFRVRTAPFSDRGRVLGYTVAFQDVTDVIARERRLSVLNRVLRHNLRNDLNVVVGHAELLADRVEPGSGAGGGESGGRDKSGGGDESGRRNESGGGDTGGGTDRSVQAILDRGRRLLSISERARELDRAVASASTTDRVAVADLCREVADEVAADTETTVTVEVPDAVRLRTDREVVWIVLANLLANAVEHGGSRVVVRFVGADDGTAQFEVVDDGPGIPETEVAVLDDAETALEHGSGLGLWVVQSGVAALGGEVAFDGSDGTTVTLRLPGYETDESVEPADDQTATSDEGAVPTDDGPSDADTPAEPDPSVGDADD